MAIEIPLGRGPQRSRCPPWPRNLVARKVDVIVTAEGCRPASRGESRRPRRSRSSSRFPARPGRQPVWSRASPGRAAISPASAIMQAILIGQSGWSCCPSWFPRRDVIAVLAQPAESHDQGRCVKVLQEAARAKGVELVVLKRATNRDGSPPSPSRRSSRKPLMRSVLAAERYSRAEREQLVALAARHADAGDSMHDRDHSSRTAG